MARQSEREKVRASEWSERRVHDAYVLAQTYPARPTPMYGHHTAVMAYGRSGTAVRVNAAVRAYYND